MYQISVLIITRNRTLTLQKCLQSLSEQTEKPFEVIVIDNNSSDNTEQICIRFNKTLNLRYAKEKRIGIPFARNRSIKLARGKILAFIDDDCIAQNNWIKTINDHFIDYPKSVGLIGKTRPIDLNNIYGLVEKSYNQRWLMQNISNLKKTTKIASGMVIDFKNAAFKKSFINNHRFSYKVPYGDVGNEDVEFGQRIFKRNSNIFFNPNIKVKHQYSKSLFRLVQRNFWSGYSQQALLYDLKINLRKTPIHYSKKRWFIHSWKQIKNKDAINMICFYSLSLLYPFISKLGRIYFVLSKKLMIKVNIPKR